MQGEFFFNSNFSKNKNKLLSQCEILPQFCFPGTTTPYAYHGKNLESGANPQLIVGSSLG
jgi:hypothetical protein